MSTVTYVNEGNFESQVVQADSPVLVDFYADWCGPCRAMSPLLDEVASDFGEDVRVSKLDIDANNSIAERYEVHSIPTLILFNDGEPVERWVGLVPKDQILRDTREHVSALESTNN